MYEDLLSLNYRVIHFTKRKNQQKISMYKNEDSLGLHNAISGQWDRKEWGEKAS